MGKTVKVLIVDDSALVRETLKKIFNADPDIEVLDAVMDPLYAVKRIKQQRPDVITLDLQMPRMDGITFLKKLMASYPLPVVVVSSKAMKGASATLEALELGAVDFVTKPQSGINQGIEELGREITEKVKAASQVNMRELKKISRQGKGPQDPALASKKEELETGDRSITATDKLICIGASTGGTVAVKKIISELPANLPGVLVVIHMPGGFTSSFAQTLDAVSGMRVKEAEDGEKVDRGTCYIAPGGYHMEVQRKRNNYLLRLNQDPPIKNLRPAVNKLFYSAAENAAPNCMGIVLTGMGDDGAEGLKLLKDKGAYTVAQDERTSVVYGMPRQALAHGGVQDVFALDKIGKAILDYLEDEGIPGRKH